MTTGELLDVVFEKIKKTESRQGSDSLNSVDLKFGHKLRYKFGYKLPINEWKTY